MKYYRIYKISNKNDGKSYIGYTSYTVDFRFNMHKYKAQEGSECYLHNAMRKYGNDAFYIEEIFTSKDRDYCKNIMENYFIKDNHSHYSEGGYNMTWGGEGFVGKHTEETKKALGKLSKGRPWTEEAKEKQRQNAIRLHKEKRIGMYGKKQTKEWAETHSKMMKGNKFAAYKENI